MELLVILNQTISLDAFKIVISAVMTILGALVGLNSFWIKKYINDNKDNSTDFKLAIKELSQNFDKSNNTLKESFNEFNDRLKEENFKLQLQHENLKKDVSNLEKRTDDINQIQSDRLNKYSIKITTAQQDIILLNQFMKQTTEKVETMSAELGKTTTASEIILFLKEQFKGLQDQVNQINKNK